MPAHPTGAPPAPCPDCGGQRVRAHATAYVKILPERAGLGTLFGGAVPHALVCTVCGYTALYVDHPDRWLPKGQGAGEGR